MANELTLSISGTYAKNGSAFTAGAGLLQVSVTGNNAIKNVISVPTANTTLGKGGIGTIGWVFLHNLDATNYLTFGDGTVFSLKLKPGEFAFVRWNLANVVALANTAACQLEYAIFED